MLCYITKPKLTKPVGTFAFFHIMEYSRKSSYFPGCKQKLAGFTSFFFYFLSSVSKLWFGSVKSIIVRFKTSKNTRWVKSKG